MSKAVITVEGLGKRYNIGALHKKQQHDTLRDKIASGFKSAKKHLTNRTKTMLGAEKFWALRDVSFEVKEGEVLGIIGKNGAGKSTLLKILCRVTSPTEGRATLNGRVGSLLEVGTGFHQELTGKENVYLSGAILGMDKAYIERKYDEIIAFSGIEKFIDTPVKRYSSGMRVRLGFAVAAYLEPEILLIDEVLAVGDAAFQKKCLGKMENITSEGRTILFVSHNMQSIRNLCTRALLLHNGKQVSLGSVDSVISEYYKDIYVNNGSITWPNILFPFPSNDIIQLDAIIISDIENNIRDSFSSESIIKITIKFFLKSINSSLRIGFSLISAKEGIVFTTHFNDSDPSTWPDIQLGENVLSCCLSKNILNEDIYYISPRISLHCTKWIYRPDPLLSFKVNLSHGVSPFWNILNLPGAIAPVIQWIKESDM